VLSRAPRKIGVLAKVDTAQELQGAEWTYQRLLS